MFGKNVMLLGKFSLLSHSLAKVAQIIDFLSYFEEGHIQCKISVATFYTTLWGN